MPEAATVPARTLQPEIRGRGYGLLGVGGEVGVIVVIVVLRERDVLDAHSPGWHRAAGLIMPDLKILVDLLDSPSEVAHLGKGVVEHAPVRWGSDLLEGVERCIEGDRPGVVAWRSLSVSWSSSLRMCSGRRALRPLR